MARLGLPTAPHIKALEAGRASGNRRAGPGATAWQQLGVGTPGSSGPAEARSSRPGKHVGCPWLSCGACQQPGPGTSHRQSQAPHSSCCKVSGSTPAARPVMFKVMTTCCPAPALLDFHRSSLTHQRFKAIVVLFNCAPPSFCFMPG